MHGQAVDPNQGDVALGMQRILATGADESDLCICKRHAGGRRIQHALGQFVGAFTEEDGDPITGKRSIRTDGDVAVEGDKIADVQLQIFGKDLNRRGRPLADNDVASIQSDRLVHGYARGINRDAHRRAQRETRH